MKAVTAKDSDKLGYIAKKPWYCKAAVATESNHKLIKNENSILQSLDREKKREIKR